MSDLVFHSLDLNNFKSFVGKHSFALNRDPGLYYITGKNKVNPELGANGVGKTTCPGDALTYVLFGKTGRDNRPGAATIPWGMEKAESSVSLKFTRMHKTQILYRSRNPNTLTLAYKNTERTVTQEEINSLIGMSEEMFRRTCVLGQFGTLFLDMGAEKQSAMFNEALSLDLWLKAAAIASAKAKTLNGQLTGLRIDASRLNGRHSELSEVLGREKVSQREYEKKLAGRIKEGETLIANLEIKLSKLGGALKSPREAQGRPSEGGGLSKGLEDALARQERALKDLRGDLGQAETALSGNQREMRSKEAALASYVEAMKGSRACPECGQKATLDHLRAKAKDLETILADLLAQKGKASRLIRTLQNQEGILEEELIEQRNRASAIQALARELKLTKDEVAKLEREDNPHDEAIKNLKQRVAEIDEHRQANDRQSAKIEKQFGICNYWVDAFKEIRLSLIDRVLEELEMAVSRHAESLGLNDWRIKFQTERETKAGNISTAFTILLYPPDKEEAVKFESYSGGESQRWQLAVAFGLSEIILARTGVAPNVEILDEPTRGLSPEGIEDLLTHLAERAQELERCIYVTEHHSLERGAFAGTITIQKEHSGSVILE